MNETTETPDARVPDGFEPAYIGGEFATRNGPLYARWHDEHLRIGFRVGPGHVNPGNNCHGGWLATFADILISTAAQYQSDIPRQFLPTISLQLDFMAAAPLGAWLQGQAEILRVTRNLISRKDWSTPTGRWPCARAASSSAGRCWPRPRATMR